jgi:nucleolin
MEVETEMKPAKKAAKAKAKESQNGEDDSEEEEVESEEEPESKNPKQKKRKSSPAKGNKPDKKAKIEAKEESDDSSEDSSEDDVDPKKLKRKLPVTAQEVKPKKKAKQETSEEDSEDGSEEEEAPSKKEKPVKKSKPEQDEDESSEEGSSEDEDDDEEDKKQKTTPEIKPQKKEKPQTDESSTLFVKGFGDDMTEKKLKKSFKGCEAIRLNLQKRFAFIDFPSAELAKEIYKANQGLEIDGHSLVVDMANKKPQKPERKSTDSNTLFVKNIPEDCTKNDIEEFFDGVSSVRMPERDGYHKGFAFVEFTSVELAKSTLQEKQGAELNGSKLFLDMAGEKPDRDSRNQPGKSNILFVKNLSFDTDEDTLKESFDGAQSARIMKFPDTGKSKGFGFVDFDSTESAQKALDDMQGQEIDGRNILVDFASPRGERGGRGGRGGGFRGGRGRDWGGRGGGRGRGGGFRGGRGGRGGHGGFGRGGFGGHGGGKGFGGGGGGGRKTHFDDSD